MELINFLLDICIVVFSPQLVLEVGDPGAELGGDVGDPEQDHDRCQTHRGHHTRGRGAEAGAEARQQEASGPASGLVITRLVTRDMA